MIPPHILKLLIAIIILGPCAGCCCHHKKGITLRGGLDFREYKKPAGFVELVDTGWDERRRMQDCRWLENSGYDESTAPAVPAAAVNSGTSESQPSSDIPHLNEPPEFEPPPMPEDVPPVPPVPGPEPKPELNRQQESELEVDEFEEAVSLPSDYSDDDDYRRMIELTGYERPVHSVANRPTEIPPSSPLQTQPRSGGWLWSKP